MCTCVYWFEKTTSMKLHQECKLRGLASPATPYKSRTNKALELPRAKDKILCFHMWLTLHLHSEDNFICKQHCFTNDSSELILF